MHKRTGLRKPKNYLKTWDPRTAKDWTRRVSPRLSVGMVDEALDTYDVRSSRQIDGSAGTCTRIRNCPLSSNCANVA
jgi:hypothetical protein